MSNHRDNYEPDLVGTTEHHESANDEAQLVVELQEQPPTTVTDDANSEEDVLYKTHYDIVICGTGLLQSILVSALARYASSRYKILHVDHADHYGNLDAVYTYSYLLSKYNNNNHCHKPLHPTPTDSCSTVAEPKSGTKQDDNDKVRTVPLHPEGELRTLRFHTAQRTERHCYIQLNRTVQTPYGVGRVQSLLEQPQIMNRSESYHTLVIELKNWSLTNNTRPKLYVGGIPSTMIQHDAENGNEWSITNHQYIWDKYRIRTMSSYHASLILDTYSRSLALDITPNLIYAAGPAVDGLLTSTVSNYIEFKSLDALLYYTPPPSSSYKNDNKSSSSSDDGNKEKSIASVGTFTRGPCSKKDVFASQLLSPLDKRRLMKFLHLALDYAGAKVNDEELLESPLSTDDSQNNGDSVSTEPPMSGSNVANELQSWNERYLNQGRSLIRPQNKVVATNELQHLQILCHQKQQEQKSFLSYLQNDQQLKSSSSLISLIRYALALDTNSDDKNDSHGTNGTVTTVQQGMEQLCAHMFALGRFGTTAFLVPLYGSGELSQAFCRSAAVYGTTYLLRRAPTALILQRTSCNDGKYQVCGIQLSTLATDDEDDKPAPIQSTNYSKQITCTHIVVPEDSIRHTDAATQSSVRKRVLRRISIVTGKPIQLDKHASQQQQRHVLIIPPNSISKKQTSAVHGVVVDETVNVTPNIPCGCTIIHLTTIIDCGSVTAANDVSDVEESILSEAMNVVLQSFKNGTQEYDQSVVEIFHASFSYELPLAHGEDKLSDETLDVRNADGLHVIQRPPPSLTVDATFTEATKIFLQICPDATKDDFLKLSQATTEAIEASFGSKILHNEDDDDDEITALNSALDMIEEPKT
jgi:RAB protein geranylgeranyltransferase component A